MPISAKQHTSHDMVQVEDLTLAWRDIVVLKDISLRITKGQVVTLIGRSGCGKTTLFQALAGFEEPAHGSITINGINAYKRHDLVGYLRQSDLLLPWLSVIDNVCLPLRAAGMSLQQAQTHAKGMLSDFGLSGTEKMFPHELSGGMRQRAALLRTHLMGREVLLCDEPFSALDAFTRKDMQRWLLNIIDRYNNTALIITHDIDEALFLSDKIIVLQGDPMHGLPTKIAKIVTVDASRTKREVFAASREAYIIKQEIVSLLGSKE